LTVSKPQPVEVKTTPADLPIIDPVVPAAAVLPLPAAETRRWSGVQGPYPAEHTELVQDSTALTAYWQLMASGQPMPQVDFQKEAVALIFMGARPTAGYSVSVEGVEEGPEAVTLIWREQVPSADSTSAQVQTRPWAMQVVPHGVKPVIFLKRP
jgi:hypothetical protein